MTKFNSLDDQHKLHLEIHIEIDSCCVLNCIHCSSHTSRNTKTVKTESNIASICQFLSSFSEKKSIYVCLTGGDPLNSDMFACIAKKVSAIDTVASIGFFSSGVIKTKSNIGSISHEMAHKLKKYGISFAYISLYSHCELTHDSITGVKGAYKNSITSIKNLLRNGISARINFVPMKSTSENIWQLVEFLKTIGVKELRILRLVNHGNATKNWGEIGLRASHQRGFVKSILKGWEERGGEMKLTVAGFPNIKDCRPFNNGIICQAGLRLLYVDIKGDVYPCACKKNDKSSSTYNIYLSKQKINPFVCISTKKYRTICHQDEVY